MSSDRRGLGRSTAVMAAGTGVSRVLGVVRASVLVSAIGLNAAAADAFQIANWLPNMLYMLIAGGVLNAVLVPQVVRAYRSADGQTYVDRLLTLSIVLLLSLTAVLTLAAPLIVRVVAGGSEPEFTALATVFAFWCIPQVFFYGLYTLLGQVLNARGQFGPYMWAPVVNNIVAISGLIAFIALFGRQIVEGGESGLEVWDAPRITVLAGSATLGVIAQALVLAIPLYRSGFRYRPRGGWRGSGLATAGKVAGWTFAALAVGQVGIFVVVRVASSAAQAGFDAGIAGYNAYTNAFLIFMLPHSLITVSLLTALFTRLSDHAAARETRAVRADFSFGLRTVSVFTLFAAVGLAVLALPLVRTLFPGITPEEAATMPPIIASFMVGLVPLGTWSLCQRVFYAYEDAKGLFRIQVGMAGIVIGGTLLGYVLLDPGRWVATAALSMSASYVLGAVWGGAQVWARLGGSLSRAIRLHVRAGIAAGVAGGAGWLVSRVFGDLVSAGFAKAALACVVVGVVMLAVYLGLLRAMGVGEADDLLRPVLTRLRRTMSNAEPGAGPGSTAEPVGSEPGPAQDGGARVDDVIGRGTLLAGRYRLHQRTDGDLPGVQCWSARDQILDRPVRALIIRGGDVHAIQDAARRAALVSEPRLLKVLDVGDHEGVAYTVTEPVVGRDLAELTVRGPLPADQARAIIAEAASALEVARRRGVHHLALRPSTVRVTPDGAVLVTGLSMDGELFGHDATGAKATSRADTVGLVALLYLTLTGRWPTHPGSPQVDDVPIAPVVEGVPVAPSELSPGVPNDLDTLCAVTLGPNDDGPHSPGELVRELEPWAPVRLPEAFGALDAEAATAVFQSAPWSDTVAQATTGPDAPTGTLPRVPADASPAAAPSASAAEPGVTAVLPPEPAATRPPAAVRPTATDRPTAAIPRTPPPRPTAPDPRPFGGLAPFGEPEPFDDLVTGNDEPLIKRRFNATPIVLGIFLIAVVVGLVLAWKAITAPVTPVGGEGGLDLSDDPAIEEPVGEDDEEDEDAEGEGEEPEATDEEPTAAPVIASAVQLDPEGDGDEHPEAVDRAIDGDPSTFWFTRTYVSPTYGMKSGIGFAVTLAEPAQVSQVELSLNSTGGLVEVRATSPSTPTEGEPLASGPMTPTTTFTFDPVTAEHIVLWFPELPQNPEGSNRVELFEIRLS